MCSIVCLSVQGLEESLGRVEKAGYSPDMPFPEDRELQEGGTHTFIQLLTASLPPSLPPSLAHSLTHLLTHIQCVSFTNVAHTSV